MKKQNNFFRAGAVLALSGIAVKAFSAAYRIPLTRMLGADTMGRYSAVLNLFMPFFSFATAGITAAVTNYTAVYGTDNPAAVQEIKRTALKLYTAAACVLSAVFLVFCRLYAQQQDEILFFYGGAVLAPSIALAAAENVFKGITQGQMNMLPTAQAGLMESFFKTALGLAGVWGVMHLWPSYKDETALVVCFGAITLSGLVCAVFLWLKCRDDNIHKKASASVSGKGMFKISVPIAVSALTVSLTSFFDTAFCLPRIDRLPYDAIVKSFDGASFMGAGDMSMYLFGIWQGMVLTVFNLPPAIVSSVGVASLPLISRSWQSDNKKLLGSHTAKLFRTTAFLAVPAYTFVFCFGAEIIQLLFGTTPQQTVVAESLLQMLCITGVFCCFGGAFNAVLYGAGRADKVFNILLSACVAKSAVGYLLCGIPQINIKAFAVSGGCFYTIIFVRSILAVKKLGINFDFAHIFALPLLASAAAVLMANWLAAAQLYSLPLFLKLFFCGVIFGCIYLLAVACTGFLVDK